jgi:hypothetical protein
MLPAVLLLDSDGLSWRGGATSSLVSTYYIKIALRDPPTVRGIGM